MPPHCDALDGPVVAATRRALDSGRVEDVLPYVAAEGEPEVRAVFDEVLPVHRTGGPAAEVADRLLFETVVRVHRAGEGAPYTGLKPAGLDVGPVIPLAEAAVVSQDASEVIRFLGDVLSERLSARMERLRLLAAKRDGFVTNERAYVSAMLDFEVFSHRLYQAMNAEHLH